MNTCDTDANSGLTSDEDDLIINYMDYSELECYNMFTSDQKDRMFFFLEGARKSLLKSLGCETPCDNPITSDLRLTTNPILICDSVEVVHQSVNAETFEWFLDDVFYSNQRTIKVFVSEKGQHQLVCKMEGSDGLCRAIDTLQFEAICPVNSEILNQIDDCITSDTTINFQAYQENGYSFIWKIDGDIVGNDANYQDLFTKGTYRIKLITKNGKCSDSTSLILKIGCQEICDNEIDDDGDGLFDCFDPDCCELCPDFYYQPCGIEQCENSKNEFSIQEKWRFDTETGLVALTSMYAGDIDSDGASSFDCLFRSRAGICCL